MSDLIEKINARINQLSIGDHEKILKTQQQDLETQQSELELLKKMKQVITNDKDRLTKENLQFVAIADDFKQMIDSYQYPSLYFENKTRLVNIDARIAEFEQKIKEIENSPVMKLKHTIEHNKMICKAYDELKIQVLMFDAYQKYALQWNLQPPENIFDSTRYLECNAHRHDHICYAHFSTIVTHICQARSHRIGCVKCHTYLNYGAFLDPFEEEKTNRRIIEITAQPITITYQFKLCAHYKFTIKVDDLDLNVTKFTINDDYPCYKFRFISADR